MNTESNLSNEEEQNMINLERYSVSLGERALRCVLLSVFLAFGSNASAGVIVNIYEDGPDVKTFHYGTLDLDGLVARNNSTSSFISPTFNGFGGIYSVAGSQANLVDRVIPNGLISPTPDFGPGTSFVFADSWFGDGFRVGTLGTIAYQDSDRVGNILTLAGGGSTYAGQNLGSMGLTPGSYVVTLDNATADTITINISGNVVPEPSSFALFAFLGVFSTRVRMRRRSHSNRKE